jgi:hypothetical protein
MSLIARYFRIIMERKPDHLMSFTRNEENLI